MIDKSEWVEKWVSEKKRFLGIGRVSLNCYGKIRICANVVRKEENAN